MCTWSTNSNAYLRFLMNTLTKFCCSCHCFWVNIRMYGRLVGLGCLGFRWCLGVNIKTYRTDIWLDVRCGWQWRSGGMSFDILWPGFCFEEKVNNGQVLLPTIMVVFFGENLYFLLQNLKQKQCYFNVNREKNIC